MASIPPSSDVWVEILKRLPPKSICRFRCVSKHWSSLLSSSFFITLHYKFSVSNTPTNQKSYFVANDYGNLEQCVVYQPQEEQLGGGVRERASFLDLPYSIDKMENEFKCICFRISGVIHGVVCLTTHENAVVWNPSIRKHISLGIGGLGVNDAAFIGFGFDAAKSDFKVVAVPYEYEYKEPFYKVYSVQDGTWRSKSFPLVSVMHSFESLPHDSIVHRPCCFVNGHIYWVMPPSGQESMCDSLLMFDCELEEFKAMALPPELVNNVRGRWPNRWRLWKHGGLLSLLAVPKPELVGQGMELWVMEEDKWTKLLTLPTDNYNALFGNDVNIMNYRCRLRLSSKDIPIRLAVYDQQPLTSQAFHKSLYLLNVKTPTPKYNGRLHCYNCYSPFHFAGFKKTLFQSRLL